MEAEPPFSIGIKLYITTLTSNVSIIDTTLDIATTESDVVVEGLNATTATMLDALVGDIADGECDH